ncbi:hypothetical protein [Paenibacillus alkaliterrae]|uniref:hypothetical protein n=1 Tax=Paenibacillus alkaliterrae TaxID=320909 RepID=UPI0039F0A67E
MVLKWGGVLIACSILAFAVGIFSSFIWVLGKGERLFRSVQQQLDRVNGVMQQNLIGMRMIRVFVRMKHETRRFGFSSEQLMDRTVAALRLTEATMPRCDYGRCYRHFRGIFQTVYETVK